MILVSAASFCFCPLDGAGSVPSHEQLCFVGLCVDAFLCYNKAVLAIELQCLYVLFVHGQCQGEMVLFYELYEACANAL